MEKYMSHGYPLLPISEFLLKEKFQQNTSKICHILYMYTKTQSCFFRLMNALVYVNIEQGIH